jgi:SAM-dependent methyltransferase
MHRSSYEKMQAFRDAYFNDMTEGPRDILDVGSASVFGEDDGYRPLFREPAWRYVGLDTAPGHNVDMVVASAYDWRDIVDESYDVVISGQAFEHIAWPWLTMMEIARVLRPGGLAAITAPSAGHAHRFPLDCWRFYPDGFPALAAFAGLGLIEQHTDQGYAFPENAFWGDVFVVLRRPPRDASDDAAWKRRHAAARESVRGIHPPEQPADDAHAGAIRRKELEALRALNAPRVKSALILALFRRVWSILRTPLRDLPRA